MPTLDVIIPCFGSREVVPEALKALKGANIIIAKEGSSIAESRNLAIRNSQADTILLLGADIILKPGALQAHIDFHLNNPDELQAALGFVQWDPRIRPSPFMEWMVHGGQQNDFDALLGEKLADPEHFFYGSHISLKTSLLKQNLFSEKFQQYGWEDLELGRRLKKEGLNLHVLHNASALHHHYYSNADILKRQHQTGAGFKHFQDVPKKPIRKLKLSLAKYTGAYLFAQFVAKYVNSPKLFNFLTVTSFWRGHYE